MLNDYQFNPKQVANSCQASFTSAVKKLFGHAQYQPLNLIKLSSANLVNNLKILSAINRQLKIAPVLKSNAYGHGLIKITAVLDSMKCPFFCVDSLYEAYELLKVKVKTPILIMGYVDPSSLRVKKLPFSFAVWEKEQLEGLGRFQPQAGVHLFVDTGMSREGVLITELPALLDRLSRFRLKMEGIMTHLAASQGPIFQHQLRQFKDATELVNSRGFKPTWIHMASSTSLSQRTLPECNLARIGISLYGIDLLNSSKLQPVMQLTTRIVQIKQLFKGQAVGYGDAFRTQKKMQLAVLPIGYADGVNRRLSNQGLVSINNQLCPIVGLVSMNLTTVDVTGVENAHIGQEVVVFSDQRSQPNSIINSAKLCQNTTYELLIGINSTIRREVVR